MYRPQFAYATPEGCRDDEFTYSFDGSNTPLLNQNISGLTLRNIPLVLEQDAPFFWRGIKVGVLGSSSAGCPPVTTVAYQFPDFAMKFQDCYQNDLSDGFVPATQYGFPQNPVAFLGSLLTGPPTVLDPEIYCPPGGYILLGIQVPTLAIACYLVVTLYGVKRFKECAA